MILTTLWLVVPKIIGFKINSSLASEAILFDPELILVYLTLKSLVVSCREMLFMELEILQNTYCGAILSQFAIEDRSGTSYRLMRCLSQKKNSPLY